MYAHNSKSAGKLSLPGTATVADVKVQVHKLASHLYVERQSIRLEARGKTLKDSDTLQNLNLRSGSKLYVKDLGPQIGWSTVFLCEYAGPLAVYLWVYQRPWIFFGDVTGASYSTTQQYVNFLNVFFPFKLFFFALCNIDDLHFFTFFHFVCIFCFNQYCCRMLYDPLCETVI